MGWVWAEVGSEEGRGVGYVGEKGREGRRFGQGGRLDVFLILFVRS